MHAVALVQIVEKERGWGQRIEGYVAFGSEEAARAYINEKHKGRSGPAPDYYVAYEWYGIQPSSEYMAKLADSHPVNGVYINNLSELKNAENHQLPN